LTNKSALAFCVFNHLVNSHRLLDLLVLTCDHIYRTLKKKRWRNAFHLPSRQTHYRMFVM